MALQPISSTRPDEQRRYVGHQAEVMLEWRLDRHFTLRSTTHFFAGDFSDKPLLKSRDIFGLGNLSFLNWDLHPSVRQFGVLMTPVSGLKIRFATSATRLGTGICF
jgi:hypothetical protein